MTIRSFSEQMHVVHITCEKHIAYVYHKNSPTSKSFISNKHRGRVLSHISTRQTAAGLGEITPLELVLLTL